MKASKYLLLSIAAALVTLLTTGCGGGGSSSQSATPATTYGASCGTNMLSSQYGCLPSCGPQSVIYNGQCVPIAAYGQNQYGQYGQNYPGYGYGGTTSYGGNMCSGNCPAGLVSVGGGWACLPQSNGCGACYGYLGGYCYQGDNARYYYGY